MKYLAAILIFIIWCVASLALSITIVGLIVVANDGWLGLPTKVFKVFDK